MVPVLTRAVIAAAGAVLAAGVLATPAHADPTDNPCQLAVTFLCRFVPIAPELDGDLDLTQQQPPVDPAAPLPESLPPADVCASGCI
jgi:hypothetical protein